MGLSGHCLCGQVTYTTTEDPKLVGHDHCDACQRQTGSAYSLVAVVPRESLKISGPVKDYAKPGDSGQDVHRIFCGNCGSPIAHAPDSMPDVIAIKAGTLEKEQKQSLKPTHEIYPQDKLSSVTISLPETL